MPATAPAAQPRPALRDVTLRHRVGAVVLALVVALGSAAGVVLLWRVFVRTYTGQRVDQIAFEGATFGQGRLWTVAEPVLAVVSVPSVALVLLAAVLIAAVRRRWELAVQVAVLMAGANLTTQLLKHVVLDRPPLGLTVSDTNTLPSGHTTAAASVSAGLVFVVPPRARPWAALLGVLYTASTGVSTLVGQWHRPSDVAAAVLVVLAWSALACALTVLTGPLRAPAADAATRADGDPTATAAIRIDAQGRGGGSTGPVMGGMLGLAGLAAGVPAVLALHRSWTLPDGPATRTELVTGYAGGALADIAVTCLAFAVLLAVREVTGRAAVRTARPSPERVA